MTVSNCSKLRVPETGASEGRLNIELQRTENRISYFIKQIVCETSMLFLGSYIRISTNEESNSVISRMTDKVKWANGMNGGYVYGHTK